MYPWGSTLEIKSPAMAILTSGPISYPVNRPIMASYVSKNGGKLIVGGSYSMFTDEYFDKEENAKIMVNPTFSLQLKTQGLYTELYFE